MAETVTDREQRQAGPSVSRSSLGIERIEHGVARGTLFWTRRLKGQEGGSDWALPYGDLMSLLLAVFVMIAAMSDLKSGPKYAKVAGGVQKAFGFSGEDGARRERLRAIGAPLTLAERLERIDWSCGLAVGVSDGTDRPLAPCEVRSGPGGLVLRIPERACFKRFGSVLEPPAGRLLSVLAGYLADGEALIEIRADTGEGQMPREVALRDGWDLAYERARATSAALIRGGVDAGRIRLMVGECVEGMKKTPGAVSQEASSSGYVEIRVRMVSTVLDHGTIAEKEPDEHG